MTIDIHSDPLRVQHIRRSPEAAVAVAGLQVSRGGRRVLHGLDFEVARGGITGLLGPSGCGKSTLMRAIVGVQIVESGDVTVLGRPAGSEPVRARVGYVMQAPAVYQDLSARENLRYFARLLGAPAARVAETLELVQLAEHAGPAGAQPVGRAARPRVARHGAARRARRAGARRADRRPRPAAARGPLAHVPRARRARRHPARLEPRDGRVFTTPHGSVRYRLPWSWSAFDYRELCPGCGRSAATRASRPRRSRAASAPGEVHAVRTDRGDAARAARRRRARLAARARRARTTSRPTRRSPAAWRSTRRTTARGDALDVLGRARRSCAAATAGACRPATRCASASAPTTRAGTSRSRPSRSPGAWATTPSRFQGNWFPHRLRAATARRRVLRRRQRRPLLPAVGRGDPHRVLLRHRLRARAARGARRRAGPRRGAAPLRGVPRAPPARVRARAAPPARSSRRCRRGAHARAAARSPAAARRPLVRLVPATRRTRRSRRRARPVAGARRLTESAAVEIAYDERGLVPVVVQDWRTGEVLTLAYANAEARRAHPRDRASCTCGAARATSCGTRARRPATRRRSGRCAWTATATRCSRSSSPPARPATPARARASTTATLEPPAPHEALPGARAHARRPRRASARRARTPSSCSTTRRGSARRSRRRPRRSRAPRARRPTTASTRRPPTSSTTCSSCCTAAAATLRRRRGGARWPSPLSPPRCRSSPSLDEVRALAREHNLVPLRHTFIDDCETPVSRVPQAARRATPSSRPSCSSRPSRASASGATRSSACARASVVRWSLGDAGDPYALAADEVGALPPGAAARPAAVRRRRGRVLRLRPRAHGRAARRAEPRRARPARHGADALRRARRLRPPQAHDHDPRQRLRRRRRPRRLLRRRRRDDRQGARGCSPARAAPVAPHAAAPGARRSRSNMPREQFEAMVARIVEYVHAGDAFQVVPSQRWSAPSSTVDPFSIYRGLRVVNPSPYMYFLDFGDFQVAGASPEPLLTVTGRHVSTRPIAGTRPRGADAAEDAAHRRGAAGRREGARRARDARRPRPQRPRPRLRVRHASRSTRSWPSRPTRTSCTSSPACRGDAARRTSAPMDALRSVLPGGHAVGRARRSARCRSSTSSSRSSAAATAARSAT